jgi:hypothetical protein
MGIHPVYICRHIYLNVLTVSYIKRWAYDSIDGQTDKSIDGQTDGQTNRGID